MLILNYAHPLTEAQLAQLAELTGEACTVRDIPVHLDLEQPFAQVAGQLADAAGLTAQEWQTEQLLLLLPSLNFAACVLLAELHGRCGYFLPVVRLRPVAGALPPRYEVAEIMDLNAIRTAARQRRY
ncbi:MAG: CRISPR-associated protein Csx15 [Anaerolineae bacterium]|nr:CRISPR-associated protein Csx15 [Anaerolineae bacterium]